MHFSGVSALLSALAIAAIPSVNSMPSQENASFMVKRNTGEAESCYMSENGEHSISDYTIEIEDCEAIVSSAQNLESTGATYYWSLDAGEKGWHCMSLLKMSFIALAVSVFPPNHVLTQENSGAIPHLPAVCRHRVHFHGYMGGFHRRCHDGRLGCLVRCWLVWRRQQYLGHREL